MRRVDRFFSGRAKLLLSRKPRGTYSLACGSAGASPSRISPSPTGMTLLEVVIALALFFAAMAAISEILHLGSDASVKAQLRAEASLLGESKLNEVVAGIVPLTPVEQQAFEGTPQWTWSLSVEDDTDVTIKRLMLTVNHLNAAGRSDHEVRFARLLRDPAIFQSSGNSESALESLQNVLPP